MECTKCKKKLELNLFSYNEKKKQDIINCICGKNYIAFRNFHIIRHENSWCHIKNVIR